MNKVEGTSAHPGFTEVPLCGGSVTGKVRPWTMRQRAEIKPKLGAIFEKLESATGGGNPDSLNIPQLILQFEDELVPICQISLELPEDTDWDDLHWEDLAVITQAVWETNIVTEAGGGLGGKLLGLLKPLIAVGLQEVSPRPEMSDVNSSETRIEPAPSSLGSPSSAAGGGGTPTPSQTP